jgi:hypothetical protein
MRGEGGAPGSQGNRRNEGQFHHSYEVNRGGWGGAFSKKKNNLTHLFCVMFTFECVMKSLKNWSKMAQKLLKFEQKLG